MITKHIHIEGRLWVEKTKGNTYHTAQAQGRVDGKSVVVVPFGYGYDDQYIQSAHEALTDLGVLHLQRYENGMLEPLRVTCEELGIRLTYSVADVGRKKDLHLAGKET